MAARYWIGNGTNTNWNSSPLTNWSATSGGVVRVAAPTVADDVIFDGAGVAGNSNSTLSATASMLSLTISAGYTQTITFNAVPTVAGNLTIHNGFTIAGSSSMTISAASTITSNGKTWPNAMTWGAGTKSVSGNLTITGNLTTSTTQTINLSGNISIGGTYIVSSNTTLTPSAAETLTANGITLQNASSQGTAKIILTGGTWSATTASGFINNPMDLQGNVTISGAVYINTGVVLTYVSGTCTTTGSTLNIVNDVTLNTAGITWNNVTLTNNNPTVTINSLFSIAATLTIGVSCSFAGTSGWTTHTLNETITGSNTTTLKEALTYTITNSLTSFSSRNGSSLLFTSTHASTKAILTLQNGASCNCLANFTRIDASGGRPIRSFNGTITDCINIQEFHDLSTITSTF